MSVRGASDWQLAEGGLYRTVVPGGWIYRDYDTGALCFVPHPQFLAGGAGGRTVPRVVGGVMDDPTRKAG